MPLAPPGLSGALLALGPVLGFLFRAALPGTSAPAGGAGAGPLALHCACECPAPDAAGSQGFPLGWAALLGAAVVAIGVAFTAGLCCGACGAAAAFGLRPATVADAAERRLQIYRR